MDTQELIVVAESLVMQGRINSGGIGLQDVEAKVLEMVNWIGDAMMQEVVAGLDEPTYANQITVGGEVAVFERVRNLRFINRFGEEVVRPRRCYRFASSVRSGWCRESGTRGSAGADAEGTARCRSYPHLIIIRSPRDTLLVTTRRSASAASRAQLKPIPAAMKPDANLHCTEDLRPEVQYPVGAAGPLDILIDRVVTLGLQQRERPDEVRLARSVRADEDVDRAQGQVLDAFNALESLNTDRRNLRMVGVVLVQRDTSLGWRLRHRARLACRMRSPRSAQSGTYQHSIGV